MLTSARLARSLGVTVPADATLADVAPSLLTLAPPLQTGTVRVPVETYLALAPLLPPALRWPPDSPPPADGLYPVPAPLAAPLLGRCKEC